MCNSLILEICMSFVIMLTVDATKVGSFRNNEDGTSDENHTNCRQSGLQVACSEITRGRTAGARQPSHTRASLAAQPTAGDAAGRCRDRTGAILLRLPGAHGTPPHSIPPPTPACPPHACLSLPLQLAARSRLAGAALRPPNNSADASPRRARGASNRTSGQPVPLPVPWGAGTPRRNLSGKKRFTLALLQLAAHAPGAFVEGGRITWHLTELRYYSCCRSHVT